MNVYSYLGGILTTDIVKLLANFASIWSCALALVLHMYVSIDWKELLVYSMYLYGGYDMDGGQRRGKGGHQNGGCSRC